jgi:hypothetical protein
MFATGSASPDNKIKIWSASSITSALYTYTGHSSDVNVLTYLSSGNLISGSSDGKAIVWSSIGTQLSNFAPLVSQKVYCVSQLADGSIAFCGNTDVVNIWTLSPSFSPAKISSLSVLSGEQPCHALLVYNSSLLFVASDSTSTELINVADSKNPFYTNSIDLSVSVALTLESQSKLV